MAENKLTKKIITEREPLDYFNVTKSHAVFLYRRKNVSFDRVFNDIEEDENQIRKSLSTGCTEVCEALLAI